jgi:diacylglycerol O-acyltransferase / wax synthase
MRGKTEPMSNVDSAWLSMEDPTNLMMVSGIMTFKTPLDFNRLRAVIQHRWLKFERFTQRVAKPWLPFGTPYWETDPTFDLNAHLRRVALPAPGDQQALQEMVSDLMSTPLDYTKPLWQMHLIENYGDGCAFLTRIHHCIADGIALMFVLMALTDLTAGAPWPSAESASESDGDEERGMGGALGALIKQASNTLNAAVNLTGRIVHEGLETLNDPDHARELAKIGGDGALAASRLLLRSPDPITPFKGKLGVTKRAAWSRPLPLHEVKRIKKATQTTVNDVLISAMVGGLRHYLITHGKEVEGLNFRAAVPVNLRKNEDLGKLGNKFGLVFLSLPVGIADPLERLAEVHRRMEELKNSAEAPVAMGILSAMGLSPGEIQNLILKIFAAKATAVMTNVPGPQFPLYMADKEIDSLMFWVPQSGRLGLGVSILSYAGQVFLGVATDRGLVPDPDVIIDGFYAEYEQLLALAQSGAALPVRTPPAAALPPLAAAPPAALAADDLRLVRGIGPKLAALLAANGITTLAQLAQTDAAQLRTILHSVDGRYRIIDPTTWPAQAAKLAEARGEERGARG